MSASKGNVHVHVCPTKAAKAAVVTVGVKAKGCYWTLKSLSCGTTQCQDMAYSTALLCALYKTVHNRMMGTMADELSSQITQLECCYQNGEFVIAATCTGSFTAIRKTACSILKWMNPARVYPAYKEALRALSSADLKLSPDKKVFLHVANAFAKSALEKTCVVISGKALLDANKVKLLAESCAAKCGCDVIKGAAAAPNEKSAAHPAGYMHLKAAGVDGMLVKKYIDTSLNICSDAAEGMVFVPNHYASALKKLASNDRISRHIGSKYDKVKDDLAAALAYVAALNCVGNSKELMDYCKHKVSGADLVKTISASFKSLK